MTLLSIIELAPRDTNVLTREQHDVVARAARRFLALSAGYWEHQLRRYLDDPSSFEQDGFIRDGRQTRIIALYDSWSSGNSPDLDVVRTATETLLTVLREDGAPAGVTVDFYWSV